MAQQRERQNWVSRSRLREGGEMVGWFGGWELEAESRGESGVVAASFHPLPLFRGESCLGVVWGEGGREGGVDTGRRKGWL